MTLSRLTAVAAAPPAAACALAASAPAAPKGAQARVTSGHVAAWIGVGGAGQGANGADEWVQIGVASLPGGTTELYYEVAFPGQRAAYTSLGPVSSGESHQVAVLETDEPNTWLVWLD